MCYESLPAEISDACRRVIADWRLDELVEPLLKATKVTLACQSERRVPRNTVPIGSTKLGGFPDLPAHAAWPKFNGRYLPFIAQINLADLPVVEGNPLPTTGRLYYFYWCTNEVREKPAHVFWLPDDKADLERRETSSDQILVDWHGESLYKEEVATKFSIGVTISVPLAERLAKENGMGEINLVEESGDFADEYAEEVSIRLEHGLDVWQSLNEADDEEAGIMIDSSTLIELLGYPDPYGLFLYSLKPACEGHTDGTDMWQNILNIGSYNNMMWSDAGSLGLFVRDCDLRRRDFSRLIVEVMSS